MIMPLSVKNQSIETSGITKDYREALCEYIWNGFEANATEVTVSYTMNSVGGIDTITISDNGDGIVFEDLSETFGAFLASRKNSLSLKVKSKANKGKGRFSFVAFASDAQWSTVYKAGNGLKKFVITLSNGNKEVLDYTTPLIVQTEHSGTDVTFWGIDGLLPESLSLENLEDVLLTEFSWYLYLNKNKKVKLTLNDQELDYKKYINSELSEEITKNIDNSSFSISLVVWQERIKEKFCCYFFDGNETVKGTDTTTFNRNTVEFNHSVFIRSSFFNGLQNVSLNNFSDQTELGQTEENQKTLRKLKKVVQEFIGQKLSAYMSGKADEEIKRMIDEKKTFPHFSDDVYGQMRKNDLIRVTKELYCLEPRIFYKLKDVQEKSLLGFLNLLLDSGERENILGIIEQIVELSPAQRQDFAQMLQKTKLENIIDTIRFIETRYQVIEILKTLVYDLTQFANERNHIQEIIEHHYWLFGEQYNLASADRPMQKALEQYLNVLYGASSPSSQLEPDAEAERRMDIFLCSARKVESTFENSMEENIVVELKAPKVPLSKKVLRQIEDYMDFVRRQPQYASLHRKWKFIAVCKSVDNDVKSQYKAFEDKGKPGLVFKVDNYEVYALTWDDIFKSFDLRHSFMLDKLNYDREALTEELTKMAEEKSRSAADELTKTAVAF
ncbi:ATP-binding protein [Harryflintia acetispora]|uniref:ATP-binding protein n=1 Tax=Harryflintia acetispora TaxID=1849041 RepID=UPI0018999B4D|nr:ATP-binding protein [Harryflintia acetispora]